LSVAENQTSVTTVSATDPDNGDVPTFSISGGADAARFSIDTNSGVLTFAATPNFELPTDADTNNDYVVEVTASDGKGGTDTQTLTVSVTDVNDAPVLTSDTSLTVSEGNLPVTTLVATDDENNPITFSLAGGADASLFTINATSGALNFTSRPNFEKPVDVGNNNSYVVNVSVTDSIGASSQKTFTINVTDVDEAPVLGEKTFSVQEGSSNVGTLLATDSDQGSTLSYSLGGSDASLFSLNSSTGVLNFIQAPSFSTPLDQNGDNRYEITVTATDNTNLSTQANVFVQVSNLNDAPVLSPQGFTVAENTTQVGTITAT
ncbi:cadherin domain-containing protein, partial [Motiliproteus sp. MSK22-1]|uniref:cadherin domain-containing protein n=1 Tax=Motiliproteus sp. MSK22-1 TaxID=1897630 RepID=UPI00117BF4E5